MHWNISNLDTVLAFDFEVVEWGNDATIKIASCAFNFW